MIFEESRHASPRDQQIIYNSITVLTYVSRHPALIVVVLVLAASTSLYWWLAHPRPKPFRHQDRLSDSEARPLKPLLDRDYLRDVLVLKLFEAGAARGDHTILSASDLSERLKGWDRARLEKAAGDKDLADLLAGRKIRSSKMENLSKKIARWVYDGRKE